jgi:uncharacterized protein (DUF697 family)
VDEDYDRIIKASVAAAAGAGPLIVIPFADPAALSTIWTNMTVQICRRAGHEIDRSAASRLALGVAAGTGAHWAKMKILLSVLAKVPLTIGPGIAMNSLLNALFTFRLGHAMIDLMEKDDFDPSDWQYMVKVLVKAIAKRPNAAEVQRVISLLKRMRNKMAS